MGAEMKDSITAGAVAMKAGDQYLSAGLNVAALSMYAKGLGHWRIAVGLATSDETRAAIQERVDRYQAISDSIAKSGHADISGGSVRRAGGSPVNSTGKDADDDDALKLRRQLEADVVTERPNVKWDEVAGLDAAKDSLKEAVVFPIKFPTLFTGKRRAWKGILFYGPPGTGKSYLAKAVATEVEGTFYSVSSSVLVSKWQGESEKLVRVLFELARENAPAIIFIDEVDSLCAKRSGSESESARRILTEFLVQMDGMGGTGKNVLVLGATNRPWDLDEGIRRRFEKRIYIPLPGPDARGDMVRIHVGDTQNALTPEDYAELGKRLEGFSGADVSILVRDALMEPIRRVRSATHFRFTEAGKLEPCQPDDQSAVPMRWTDLDGSQLADTPITRGDLDIAASRTKPSVSAGDLAKHEKFTAEFGNTA